MPRYPGVPANTQNYRKKALDQMTGNEQAQLSTEPYMNGGITGGRGVPNSEVPTWMRGDTGLNEAPMKKTPPYLGTAFENGGITGGTGAPSRKPMTQDLLSLFGGVENGGIAGGMGLPNSTVPPLPGDAGGATGYRPPPDIGGMTLPPPAGDTVRPNTPSTSAAPTASAYDIEKAYGDILTATKGAADASLANTQQQLYGQMPGINQNYDAMNRQAYANARVSALGNNEALAAQGLAGSAYAGPQSGYSESSRVAQDAALGNAINSNELARRNALDTLTGQANQARTARDASVLGAQADILGQQASATQQESQFGRSLAEQQAARQQSAEQWTQEFDLNKGRTEAELTGKYNGQDTFAAQQAARQLALQEAGLTGMYNGQQTLAGQQAEWGRTIDEANLMGQYNGQDTLAGRQLNDQEQQQQMANAMDRINLMGVVDAEAARLTGLPVGTKSAAANQWYQEFNFQKQQAALARRGGRGRDKNTTISDADIDAVMGGGDGGGTKPVAKYSPVTQQDAANRSLVMQQDLARVQREQNQPSAQWEIMQRRLGR